MTLGTSFLLKPDNRLAEQVLLGLTVYLFPQLVDGWGSRQLRAITLRAL